MSNQHLFNNRWCPLFGGLPEIDDPPSSPAYRCIDIIKEARLLFGAVDIFPGDNYPAPERVEGLYALSDGGIYLLSKPVLTSIRFIYFRIWEIMFRAQWISGKWNEYGQPKYDNPYCDDHNHLRIAQDQVTASFLITESLETNSIDHTVMRKVFDAWGPGILFALYAICEAWQILRDLLIEGEEEEGTVVLKRLFIASAVMDRARTEESKIERLKGFGSSSDEFDLIPGLEDQQKKAELSDTRRTVALYGWKERKPVIEAEQDAIKAAMIELGRRRNLKLNSVAAKLHKHFNKSQSTLRHLFTKEAFEVGKMQFP